MKVFFKIIVLLLLPVAAMAQDIEGSGFIIQVPINQAS